MDFIEKNEITLFHVRFNKFNGTEAKVFFYLLSISNSKTGKAWVSLNDLAMYTNCSKVFVSKAIKYLISENVIKLIEKGSGRSPTVYKITTMDELKLLHCENVFNKKWEQYDRLKQMEYGDLIESLETFNEGCDDCNHEKEIICDSHRIDLIHLKSSRKYKEYQIWLLNNPEPPSRILSVKGILCEDLPLIKK